jgi:DMSO/TMAO reductase YedYZ molybdopterin-dependent catalytic subunit
MKALCRPLLIVCALLLIAGVALGAAACGTSEQSTTTAAAPAMTGTTAAARATTTAPATDTTAGVADSTAGGGDTSVAAGASGTIQVKGLVERPSTITVDELQKMNPVTLTADHPKLGPTEYTGVRFSALLLTLNVRSTATLVDFYCTDGYIAEVSLADINGSADSMIAIGKDGSLNTVMPGMTGKAWAKNVMTMEFK